MGSSYFKIASPLIKFLVLFVVIHESAMYAYDYYLHYYYDVLQYPNDPFTQWVSEQVVYLLRAMGLDANLYYYQDIDETHLYIGDRAMYYVSYYCGALDNLILMVAVFLALPGSWRVKWWFIPVSIVVYHLSNVGRLTALAVLENLDDGSMYTRLKPIAAYSIHVSWFAMFVIWFMISGKKSA